MFPSLSRNFNTYLQRTCTTNRISTGILKSLFPKTQVYITNNTYLYKDIKQYLCFVGSR